jgi:hypothetical protein
VPHLLENAGGDPLLEAVVGRGTGTEAGGVQRLPLAAGTQHKEDGFHADPIGSAWSTAAEAVRVLMLGEQQLELQPQVLWQTPLIHHRDLFHRSSSRLGSCQRNSYSCTQKL